MYKSITVEAIFSFEVDTSDLFPELISVDEVSKALTKNEIEYLISNHKLNANDFSYKIVSKERMKKQEEKQIRQELLS